MYIFKLLILVNFYFYLESQIKIEKNLKFSEKYMEFHVLIRIILVIQKKLTNFYLFIYLKLYLKKNFVQS